MKTLIIGLLLTGCGTVTQVQMPCLGPSPAEPAIRHAETRPDKAAAVQDYLAEMRAYVYELKAQMAACK